jgi:hypothetical protein
MIGTSLRASPPETFPVWIGTLGKDLHSLAGVLFTSTISRSSNVTLPIEELPPNTMSFVKITKNAN